jgi:hypothetical protein
MIVVKLVIAILLCSASLVSIANDTLSQEDVNQLTSFYRALDIKSYITFNCDDDLISHTYKKDGTCSTSCGETNHWSRFMSLGVSSEGTQYYYSEKGLLTVSTGNCYLDGFQILETITLE